MSAAGQRLRNLLSSAAVTVGSAVGSVLIGVAVSRGYGVAAFGAFSLALAIARVASSLGDFGLNTLTSREGAREPGRVGALASAALVVKSALMVPALLAGAAATWWLGEPPYLAVMAVVLVDAALGELGVLHFHVFISQRAIPLQAAIAVPVLALRVVVAGALAAAGAPFWAVAVGLASCHLAQLVAAHRTARGRAWVLPFSAAADKRALLRSAAPIGAANLLNILYFKLDTLLLAAVFDAREVGLYNAAYMLMTGTTIASLVIRSTFFPELVEAFNGRGEVRKVSAVVWAAILGAGAVACAGIALLGPWVLRLVFGPQFEAAAALLPIFAAAAIAVFANEAAQAFLIASDQQQLNLRCGALALALNLALNLALIPRLGMAGAAWATLATECLGALLRVGLGAPGMRRGVAARPAP